MNKQLHTYIAIITNMLWTHIQHPIFKSMYSANLPLIKILAPSDYKHWWLSKRFTCFLHQEYLVLGEWERGGGRIPITPFKKKKTWSKREHMEQYREGTFSPFFLFLFPFHFCCGHCLYLPHLAGVYIGTARCVCKFFSFSTVSGCSSTLLEHWQSLSWKSNP